MPWDCPSRTAIPIPKQTRRAQSNRSLKQTQSLAAPSLTKLLKHILGKDVEKPKPTAASWSPPVYLHVWRWFLWLLGRCAVLLDVWCGSLLSENLSTDVAFVCDCVSVLNMLPENVHLFIDFSLRLSFYLKTSQSPYGAACWKGTVKVRYILLSPVVQWPETTKMFQFFRRLCIFIICSEFKTLNIVICGFVNSSCKNRTIWPVPI